MQLISKYRFKLTGAGAGIWLRSLNIIAILIVLTACSQGGNNESDADAEAEISKPKGMYTSSFGGASALDHESVRGGLIRVKWQDLEPLQGQFDFSKVEEQLVEIKSRGLNWSLAVIGGGTSPDWLIDSVGVDFFEIIDGEGSPRNLPKIWDPRVNENLMALAQELAATYGIDDKLVLVYIPQMTKNGIEGHFNGLSTYFLGASA